MCRQRFMGAIIAFILWTVAASWATAASGSLAVTEVHGHILGENIQDYLSRDAQLQKDVQSCTQVLRKKKPQVTNHDYAFNQGKVEKAHRWDCCQSLVGGINNGTRVMLHTVGYTGTFGSSMTINPNDDLLTYDRGVLVSISTYSDVMRSGDKLPPRWEDVVSELTRRLGKPTRQLDRITQNTYGATFHHRVAVWDNSGYYAEVFEKNDSIGDPENDILIETPEEHRKAQAAQRQSVSSALE